MSRRLLVIDDDHASCRLMTAIFEAEGFEVVTAHDGEAGLAAIEREAPDVVALDLELPGPGPGGLEILERLGERLATLPVVILTAHREVHHAVRAMRLGAYDYLTKPIATEAIVLIFNRALERHDLRREIDLLRRRVEGSTLRASMGTSPQIEEIVDQIHTVASSNFTVLILGETGTGKELIAQALHRESERAHKPFIAIDCGAIPDTLLESELFGYEKGAFSGAERRKDGQFQLAEGGTLFFDEIGNLAVGLQSKLLRAIESRQIQPVGATRPTATDLRFIAATNVDLEKKVAAREFRADLFFRLAQYTISLPALRERSSDIPYLATRFMTEASIELRRPVRGFAASALELLIGFAWPGNVRELRNVVRQAVLRSTGAQIEADLVRDLLPSDRRSAGELPASGVAFARSLKEIADEAAHAAERIAIVGALHAAGGNKTQAARALRTDYKTLHVKMKLLSIDAQAGGAASD